MEGSWHARKSSKTFYIPSSLWQSAPRAFAVSRQSSCSSAPTARIHEQVKGASEDILASIYKPSAALKCSQWVGLIATVRSG